MTTLLNHTKNAIKNIIHILRHNDHLIDYFVMFTKTSYCIRLVSVKLYIFGSTYSYCLAKCVMRLAIRGRYTGITTFVFH